MKSKIAIVGTCPSSRMLAMRLPEEWEIWACSPGNTDLPRFDVWFELHGDLDFPSEGGQWEPYFAWMTQMGRPVMGHPAVVEHLRMMDPAHLGRVFPAEALCREFGLYFFTSQPAWMVGHAILSGAKEIGLFGLDMAARSEYGHQKPAILHFACEAARRGVSFYAPPESEVLTPPPLYGYSTDSPMGRKLRTRQREVDDQIRVITAEMEERRMKLQHFRGVADDLDWQIQTWTGGPLYQEAEPVQSVKSRPHLVNGE